MRRSSSASGFHGSALRRSCKQRDLLTRLAKFERYYACLRQYIDIDLTTALQGDEQAKRIANIEYADGRHRVGS